MPPSTNTKTKLDLTKPVEICPKPHTDCIAKLIIFPF